jgi:hypothetical protein
VGVASLERIAVKREFEALSQRRSQLVTASNNRRITVEAFLVGAWVLVACLFSLVLARPCLAEPADLRATVLLVVGAPGESEYGTNFAEQATSWQKACAQADARVLTLGLEKAAGSNDYDTLKATLSGLPKDSNLPLWVVLIGHGSFDGKEAWFNLRGPDFSASDLSAWLKPFTRPVALINTASCSGPFLNKASGTNRVVVTATRSGNEQNFARFGEFFAKALTDPQADIDQDGQVSLLEAFLTASHNVGEYYKSKGRLVTEHALIDDNGDGLGTPAEWFRGLRATRQAKDGAALDGPFAQRLCLIPSTAERALTPEQVAQRDAVEKQILDLRNSKSQLPEDQYYEKLEVLLVRLARFYSDNPATNASTR